MRYDIQYACISHIGRVRSMNQDNFLCDKTYADTEESVPVFPLSGTVTNKAPILFGVFDGMGGEECGEIASFIAAEEAAATKWKNGSAQELLAYCRRANDRICAFAQNQGVSSMGTTAAMLLFSRRCIALCNIGDSRVFRVANGNIKQISVDHVATGVFGRKPPLLQNLGIPSDQLNIEPYLSQGPYQDGDTYLICSDGVTDMLTVEEIAQQLELLSVTEAADTLVEKALENGGRDNITVVVLRIQKTPGIWQRWLCKRNGGEEP